MKNTNVPVRDAAGNPGSRGAGGTLPEEEEVLVNRVSGMLMVWRTGSSRGTMCGREKVSCDPVKVRTTFQHDKMFLKLQIHEDLLRTFTTSVTVMEEEQQVVMKSWSVDHLSCR